MPEAPKPAFVMHGSREVFGTGSVHIEQQIAAIEEAVDSNAGLAFDLAKTLLESVCKTILSVCGCRVDDAWDLPKLLKETLKQLRLVPAGLVDDREVTDSLRRLAGGLQTTIQGICELRNTHGFASHGRDAEFEQLERMQALLVARSTDAVVAFLFRAHRDYRSAPRPLAFDDHAEFNEYVDEMHPRVRIFDEEFEPSRVLFELAPEPYRVYLGEFQPKPSAEEPSVEGSTERSR